jgi:hypothetical protein
MTPEMRPPLESFPTFLLSFRFQNEILSRHEGIY